MEVKNIFYSGGIALILIAIFYFLINYLLFIAYQIKVVLIFLISFLFFLVADFLRRYNI